MLLVHVIQFLMLSFDCCTNCIMFILWDWYCLLFLWYWLLSLCTYSPNYPQFKSIFLESSQCILVYFQDSASYLTYIVSIFLDKVLDLDMRHVGINCPTPLMKKVYVSKVILKNNMLCTMGVRDPGHTHSCSSIIG